MRSIQSTLTIMMFAVLAGCGKQVAPAATNPIITARPAAAAAKDVGPERAKEIVAAKFTEATTQVVSVEVLETTTPLIYDFTCTYRRAEFGKICLYVAKGQVDTDTAKIRSSHRVSTCLGADQY